MAFEADDQDGITPARLARALIDEQRLAMTVEYLAWADVNPRFGDSQNTVFDLITDPEFRTYQFLSTAPQDYFNVLPGRLRVTRVVRENPVTVSSVLKVPGQIVEPLFKHFKTLFDRFYFTDLERERKRRKSTC